MDKLLSEQKVLKTIDNLKANFTCYDSVTLDEVYSHVKAIPSAEPTYYPPCEDCNTKMNEIRKAYNKVSAYKGMTNGEVIKALFPQYTYMGVCVFDKNENIILHDINWNWWNSPYKSQESEEVNG